MYEEIELPISLRRPQKDDMLELLSLVADKQAMTVEIASELVPRAEKKPKSTKAAPILKAARGWTAVPQELLRRFVQWCLVTTGNGRKDAEALSHGSSFWPERIGCESTRRFTGIRL